MTVINLPDRKHYPYVLVRLDDGRIKAGLSESTVQMFEDKEAAHEYFYPDAVAGNHAAIYLCFLLQHDLEVLDFDAAVELMQRTDEAEVFVDEGWGDTALMATIIRDGDGENPLAAISKATLTRLLTEGRIGPNCLQTFKARRLHPFIS